MERLVLWHRSIPPSRDDVDDPEAVAAWTRSVADRVEAIGGQILAVVGSAVAVAFEPVDMRWALDLALSLMEDAERSDRPVGGLPVCIGVALGEISDEKGVPWFTGGAIDLAQLLANRARPGEIVLDGAARDAAAASQYLFARRVGAGRAALRGFAIDRNHPRRSDCRRAIRHLRPAGVAPVTHAALATAAELLASGRAGRVLLRGPSTAGAAAWLEQLEQELEPPLVLRVRGTPGGLEPLGSLRLSLLRRWHSPIVLAAGLEQLGPDAAVAGRVLARVARGERLPRIEVAEALYLMLDVLAADVRRPWVLIDDVDRIDPATLQVISEATGPDGAEASVVVRVHTEGQVPGALASTLADAYQVVLPALRLSDARTLTAAVIGDDPSSDVARRVAVLAGDTPVGVEEAARTLVAAGDLVWDGARFGWRVAPRGGIKSIPTSALVAERVSGLEPELVRLLEIVCAMPSGESDELLYRVAELDGLPPARCEQLLEQLRLEALVTMGSPASPISSLVSTVVDESMPDRRRVELYGRIAEAHVLDADAVFPFATVGYFLAEAAEREAGVAALFQAAKGAVEARLPRCAVRLAAAAVQYDPTPQTRDIASKISRALSSRPPPASGPEMLPVPSPPPPPAETSHDLVKRAIDAILARDFDAVDRCLDTALAEGRSQVAIERVRAVAQLARGDASTAMRTLARARARAADGRPADDGKRGAREALARALILLEAGDAGLAVREAMRALATARGLKDPRGEAAAMHALASCYTSLGRTSEAHAIEEASPA